MSVPLFSPIRLRELQLENRIVVSPMCQYSASEGRATHWHMVHLGQLMLSGAGMVCIDATAVEPIGRITPGCLGLYDDDCETALARVIACMRAVSPAAIAIQLAHAGRKASSNYPWAGGRLLPESESGWQPVAPSPLPHLETEPAPRALGQDALDKLKLRFVDAVLRAEQLGLDAIELHAAHGYLLHQFLSPLANQRADRYGGSSENRMRFPLEVFEAMRTAWPEHKPMGVRLSSTDWVEGGWDLEQTIEMARRLRALGVDWIDCSSGGVSRRQKIPVAPGYQVPFAETVRRDGGVPTIAVGLITEPQQANAIIAEGKADMVALARGMLYDPRWPWHAAAELGASVTAPPQYWRAQPRQFPHLFGDTRFGQR
ncbi:MAG: NADH:flavin oxidoreductase/NADH oxidase [Burkholderiales bacterium]|nr:MAG: NADH:flavin oxidoreductase/NADH oxidase [Burkholderiales bacterium]